MMKNDRVSIIIAGVHGTGRMDWKAREQQQTRKLLLQLCKNVLLIAYNLNLEVQVNYRLILIQVMFLGYTKSISDLRIL